MRTAALSLALAALCLPLAAAEGGKPGPFTHVLKAGEIAEDCVTLKSGQSREYAWTADTSVKFNLHWHEGETVHYPVRLDGQWKGRGRFTADRDQAYCWMWSAPKAMGATVTGTFKPIESP
ncbi:MAG: hypothetical protein IPJ28_12205 [Betaproteobacteria bacterium]|nr:hypothetical protein [Betaproteobacteria bacterium]